MKQDNYFNEESFKNKLHDLQATQESIQTLSLWCIHHKDCFERIIEVWVDEYRDADSKLRLNLLYLANDIIQTARQKRLDSLRRLFLPALKEAFVLIKNDPVRPNVDRIVKIWEDRNIYEPEYLEQLRSLLPFSLTAANNHVVAIERKQENSFSQHDNKTNSSRAPTHNDEDINKMIANFRPEVFLEELRRFQDLEKSIDSAKNYLPSLNFEYGETLKKHLKDRMHGMDLVREIDEAKKKLASFVKELEIHLQQRRDLIMLIDQATQFYQIQLGEVNIVENAYRQFGDRIEQVKRQLDELKMTLPTSPPRDAPSPTPYDDPFEQGVEAVVQAAKKDTDKVETIDMDLDDEDRRHHQIGMINFSHGHELSKNKNDMMINMGQSFLNSSDALSTKFDPRIKPRAEGEGSSTPTMDEPSTSAQTFPSNSIFTQPSSTFGIPVTTHVQPANRTDFNAMQFLSQYMPKDSNNPYLSQLTSTIPLPPPPSYDILSGGHPMHQQSTQGILQFPLPMPPLPTLASSVPYDPSMPPPNLPSPIDSFSTFTLPPTPTAPILAPFSTHPPSQPTLFPSVERLPSNILTHIPPPSAYPNSSPYMGNSRTYAPLNATFQSPSSQRSMPVNVSFDSPASLSADSLQPSGQFELGGAANRYLEDYTSNPEEVEELLYNNAKVSGGGGSNKNNLTVLSGGDDDMRKRASSSTNAGQPQKRRTSFDRIHPIVQKKFGYDHHINAAQTSATEAAVAVKSENCAVDTLPADSAEDMPQPVNGDLLRTNIGNRASIGASPKKYQAIPTLDTSGLGSGFNMQYNRNSFNRNNHHADAAGNHSWQQPRQQSFNNHQRFSGPAFNSPPSGRQPILQDDFDLQQQQHQMVVDDSGMFDCNASLEQQIDSQLRQRGWQPTADQRGLHDGFSRGRGGGRRGRARRDR